MKKAIIYARVSTDRQAEHGYSREDQVLHMRSFCKQNGYEIINEYLEDYSAKSFKRPTFNQILSDLKTKKVKAEIMVVPKIDRFTRNLADTFGVIAELAKYNVTVVSIAEGEMDFNNPHKFFPLIVQTGVAQYDNMLRSDNTKRGMRQAMKNGRCVFNPPKGYVNNKLTKSIEINEPVAEVVKWAFNEYSKGIFSAEEIRRKAIQNGLNLTKQGFLNMLKNPVYAGKILIPANEEEPQQIVPGAHEAIISEEVFYTVQKILSGKRKPYKQSKNDILNLLPLRGRLICPNCGHILTGSTPRGGSGGKYPYYHCQQTKYKCKFRQSANKTHEALAIHLKQFQPPEEILCLFQDVLQDVFNLNDKDRLNQKEVIDGQIKALEKRIQNITDDYADGKLTILQFNSITKKYEEQKNELIMQHATFTKVPPNFNNYISYSCGLLKNLSSYYVNALPSTQNRLISLIFPENLVFTGSEYKTAKTNEVFKLISTVGKGLQKNSPAKNAGLYSEAPPARLERATL